MKKLLSFTLVLAMLCTMLPMSVLAYDQYIVYAPQSGCQLTSFSFTKAVNSWLMWDVTFDEECDGRLLVSAKKHPNILDQEVIPTFDFEGTSVTFNGTAIESGVTAVKLQAENDVVVYNGTDKAEYQVNIEQETNGIPVVLIDTNGAAIPDKVNYVDTAITILGADVYGGEDMYAVTGGIKLRGNSTSGYDKKPYRIKFDKKQDVFGLGKAKSWVLLANYLDPAGVRNDLAYAFATRLNEVNVQNGGLPLYVPRMRPVEVYLNGEYRGLYDMGDHVQVDGTRIDIDESGDEFDDNDVQLFPEGNVGYYLEIEHATRVIPEWYSENAYYFTIKNSGGVGTETIYTGNLTSSGSLETAGTGTADTLYVQIKTPEIPSDEQYAYIQEYVQNVNDLILAKDERAFDYIDIDSFIDWYLVNELFKNTDSAFLSSIKMHKDKDGKLRMGPVWDFDIGSGAVAYNNVQDPTGWLTRDNSRCGWYKALFSMPTFTEAVEKRWADLHESGAIDQIITDINQLSVYLDEAFEDNYTMWHENYVNAVNNTSWLSVPSAALDGDWIENVQYIRAYMTGRIQWFDEQFHYTETSAPDYVNMLSSTLTSTSSSKTFEINKTYNVSDLPNLYLSVYSRGQFDITFNFDVGSPSLSSDWHGTDPLLPFQGTTGQYIASGTYTNVALNIDNYIPYSSNPYATTITLESIVVKTSGSRRNVQVTALYASDQVQANIGSTASTAIGGKVFILGNPEYKQTLTAQNLALTPSGASVTYQWYADNTAISGATSSTFTPDSSYIGKDIYVVVKGSGSYTGTVTSDTVTLQKTYYTYKTSQVPPLVSKTHDTIVVEERENYEISVDGINWQVSGTFTGLHPNTAYAVIYRHGETANQTGGMAGNPLYVITDVDPNAPVDPPVDPDEPVDPPVDPDEPVDPPVIGVVGDVSGDGEVSTVDARMIISHLIGTDSLTDEQLALADFDGSGDISTTDVRTMLVSLIG